MRVLRLGTIAAALPCALAGVDPLKDSWNEAVVGRSANYQEIELKTMIKKIKQWMAPDENGVNTKSVLVSLYGDGCKFCQEIHPEQEKGAKKVLKDTDEIAFARLDVNRFGGPRIVAKKLKDHIEADKDLDVQDFDKITVMGNPTVDNNNEPSVHLAIPQMWLFKKDWSEIKQVEHGSIGWGPEGGKKLRQWMRENAGYERKKKKKKSKKSDTEEDSDSPKETKTDEL